MKVLTVFLVFSILVSYGSANFFDGIFSKIFSVYNSVPLIRIPTRDSDDIQILCGHSGNRDLQVVSIDDPNVLSKIDVTKILTFFVHGFYGTLKHKVYQNFVKHFWDHKTDMLCYVDWEKLAKGLYGRTSQIHTRRVADYITKWTQFIQTKGVSLDNIQCVGHSLGAHTCGFVGANFEGNMSKIVGLDPAGPGFSFPVLAPINMRLDKTDAKRVEVIHSSDKFCGIGFPIGHIDYYINGGSLPQIGCFLEQIVCGHLLAITIYEDSLTPNGENCIGIKCKSGWDYFWRKCDSNDTTSLVSNSENKEGSYI